ncbi:MAG: hypothetical protein QMD53_05375 [Actinomycetota bacterium]|nr:hypothetical protein [Actinomycetota bacterium]
MAESYHNDSDALRNDQYVTNLQKLEDELEDEDFDEMEDYEDHLEEIEKYKEFMEEKMDDIDEDDPNRDLIEKNFAIDFYNSRVMSRDWRPAF